MVSMLGFGGIRLGRVSEATAKRLLNEALDRGINFFDTAAVYGDSEDKVGAALHRRRGECIIASKAYNRDGRGFTKHLNESLRKLRTDHIDLYQLHDISRPEDWNQITAPKGMIEAAQRAQRQGKFRFLGVSGHEPKLLMRAMRLGIFDTVQVGYSPVNLAPEGTVLPLAQKLDMGVINMKPLAGGELVVRPHRTAGRGEVSAPQALNFCWSNPAISVVIPGTWQFGELRQNVAAARRWRKLTPAQRERLVRCAGQLGKDFCRGCGYCLPCPEKIDIPAALRLLGQVRRYKEDWDTMHRARRGYGKLERTIDHCIDCGRCERHCPYGLPIRKYLAEAQQRLGG